MISLLHDFRKKSNTALWRVLLFLWIISVVNIIISSSFTISEKDQSVYTAIHSTDTANASLLEAFLYFVWTGVNPNADLSDVEDSIDKIEFISTRYNHFKTENTSDRILPLPSHGTLLNIFLEKSTPPPKVG